MSNENQFPRTNFDADKIILQARRQIDVLPVAARPAMDELLQLASFLRYALRHCNPTLEGMICAPRPPADAELMAWAQQKARELGYATESVI